MKYEVKVGSAFDAVEVEVDSARNVTITLSVSDAKKPSASAPFSIKKFFALAMTTVFATTVFASAAYGASTGDYSPLKEIVSIVKDVLVAAAKTPEAIK